MTNDVLKIIMTLVLGLVLVGVAFWYVSDKYPMYAARKEVVSALKDIRTAYQRYGVSADEPVSMELMYKRDWVILEKETKLHWTFEMYGDPPHTIVAQSTPAMPGGRDRYTKCEIATGRIWGWGTDNPEDSTRSDK